MSAGDPASLLHLPTTIGVTLRRPAEIELHARLARAVLGEKRTGIRRWPRKAAQALFHAVHQRLGVAAPATMTVAGAAPFTVDCANTAFLDYARRSRSAAGVEPEVGALLTHLAPRLRVVYDIGANWGFYPLLLGGDPHFAGHIHAFEIQPRTAADLRHVVAGAGLAERVTVHGHGLSDDDGTARLAPSRHSYLARIVGEGHQGATVPVSVRRLDGLALPPPDLIKLDVEGHEAAVLRGGRAMLERNRPLIVLESWHDPAAGERMLEPMRLLAGLGYEFRRLFWRPADPTATAIERPGAVELVPLAVDERPTIAATLNLLACHPATAATYFRSAPG